MLMGRPGAAFLPRTNRINHKRAFPRPYYFTDNYEQRRRVRTRQMAGFVSESTDA